MDLVISFPQGRHYSPQETADMTVEIAGEKFKVSVWTWDIKNRPMCQLLLEKDR